MSKLFTKEFSIFANATFTKTRITCIQFNKLHNQVFEFRKTVNKLAVKLSLN